MGKLFNEIFKSLFKSFKIDLNVIKDGHVFSSSVKSRSFHPKKLKKYLAIHEIVLMRFFTSSMERLKKLKGSEMNTLLKQEVEGLKTGADFQQKWFEKAKRYLKEVKERDPIE